MPQNSTAAQPSHTTAEAPLKLWDLLPSDDPTGMGKALSAFLQTFKEPGDDPNWSTEYFRWKIADNPAGKGFINLALSEGSPIGSATYTKKRVSVKGRIVTWAELGDCYTHPEFQRRGVLAALINQMKERAFQSEMSAIYGLPTEQARRVEEKHCNFTTHPHLKIANCISLYNLAKLAGDRIRWMPRILAILLSAIANVPLKALNLLWLAVASLSGLSITLITDPRKLGPDYDLLWEKCQKQNDVLLVRDRNHLLNRFFAHPLAQYHFYECRRKGALQGYLVSRVQKIGGRRKCIIADWLHDRDRPLTFLALLNKALRDGIQSGCDYFGTWGNRSSGDKRSIMISGFLIGGRQPVIIHKDESASEILGGRLRWHFTIADSDNV